MYQNQAIHYGNDIILNGKCDFTFKLLKKCNWFDAYNALICAKKNTLHNTNEKVIFRLIKSSKFSFIDKGDFYLQKIVIDCNVIEKYKHIYLLEDFIARFCLQKVKNDNGWIYIEKIDNNWRIICGINRCIVLSRFLSEHINIEEEITRTITYLQRFNIVNKFELFRKNQNDISELIKSKKHIKAIQIQTNKYCKNIICNFMNCISAFIIAICLYLAYEKPDISEVKAVTLQNDYFTLQITPQNIDIINEFIKSINDNLDPMSDFRRIKILYPNLNIDKISLSKNDIEIHTKDKVQSTKTAHVTNNHGENVICIKK